MEVKTRKSTVRSRCSMKTSTSTQPPPPQTLIRILIILRMYHIFVGLSRFFRPPSHFRGWNWVSFCLLKKKYKIDEKMSVYCFLSIHAVLSIQTVWGSVKLICQFETINKIWERFRLKSNRMFNAVLARFTRDAFHDLSETLNRFNETHNGSHKTLTR